MLFEHLGRAVHLCPRRHRPYKTAERLGVARNRMNEISLCLQRCQLGVTGFNYQYFGVDPTTCDFSKTLSIQATNEPFEAAKVPRAALCGKLGR